jgi:hypothetical protein
VKWAGARPEPQDSDWYRSRWGHRVKFLHDHNLKGNYRNTRGGQRISGIITSVTGRGGDIIIYDDPHAAWIHIRPRSNRRISQAKAVMRLQSSGAPANSLHARSLWSPAVPE